ncbi:MAG TPA: hypothetical protein VK633_02540, partial [Verrucomicrobiae bacterium]|nr:hypothetical protein [Verrucomicrobiae bacterium]
FQGEISLVKAQENFKRGASASGLGPLAKVDLTCSNILVRQEHKLFLDVREALGRYQANVSEAANRLVQSIPDAELRALEAAYLVNIPEKGPAVLVRRDVLAGIKALDDVPMPPEGQKIGREGFFLQKLDRATDDLAPLSSEKTGLPNSFRETVAWLIKKRADQRGTEFLQGYRSDANTQLAHGTLWPLGADRSKALTAAEVSNVRSVLARMDRDFKAPAFEKHLQPEPPQWETFRANLSRLNQLASVLVDENGVPPRVKVTILSYEDANPADTWRKILEFVQPLGGGDALRIGDRDIRDKDLGTHPIDKALELSFTARQELRPAPKVKEFKLRTKPWGVLDLINRPDTQLDPAAAGVWLVNWPLDHPDLNGSLRMRLQWLGAAPFVRNPGGARP